jgi:hypothetical protein
MDRFEAMAAALGAKSHAARARLIGMDVRTLQRQREGWPAGDQLVAQTLAVFNRYRAHLASLGMQPDFDELFEVVEVPAGPVAA